MHDDPKQVVMPRRHFLWTTASGVGGVALACLAQRDTPAIQSNISGPHFAPKAKRVIHIFCAGGVSQVDTFDYKPELDKLNGQPLKDMGENKGFFGQPGNLMKSVYPFRQHGKSGKWVSDVFPQLAKQVDDLCFIQSMVAKSNNHTPATFQMNSGYTMNGFPCLGAWLNYGLGTMNENLPSFVVLPDSRGLPAGGSINWTAGFLPANYQGVSFRTGASEPIADLNTPAHVPAQARSKGMDFLAKINRNFVKDHEGDTAFGARLRSYELAARMQMSVPEATDISGETPAMQTLYGLDDERTKGFGKNCLLARRLLEKGVRFVQVLNGGSFGSPRINWDGHENLKENHDAQAATMDKPVAGLIQDLKQRGLLDDTLLIWSTEFGRSPVTQGLGANGRDHHPDAFTCFLAGAGIKKGFTYGKTDDVGYSVKENPVSIYDLHATILHVLGIDHEKLTFYHNGVKRRLTDVHGEVVRDLLV